MALMRKISKVHDDQIAKVMYDLKTYPDANNTSVTAPEVIDDERLRILGKWASENPHKVVEMEENGKTLLHHLAEHRQYSAMKRLLLECVEHDTLAKRIAYVFLGDKSITGSGYKSVKGEVAEVSANAPAGISTVASMLTPKGMGLQGKLQNWRKRASSYDGVDCESVLEIACRQVDHRMVHRLLGWLGTKKVWIASGDLEAVATIFDSEIVPYLHAMKYTPPGNSKASVCQTCARFEIMDGVFYTLGSNNESSYEEGLWETFRARLKKLEESFWSRLKLAIRNFNPDDLTVDLNDKSVPVKVRCIGMAYIGGKPDGDRHELLEALYLTGNNDIFGTPVMQAVLDFKWQTYAGEIFRKDFLLYLLYLLAHCLFVLRFHCAPFKFDNLADTLASFIPAAIFLGYTVVMFVFFCVKWRNQGLAALFKGENAIFNSVELLTIFSSIATCAELLVHNNGPHYQLTGGESDMCGYGVAEDMDAKSYRPQIWGAFSALMIWTHLFMKMRSFASIGPFVRMVIVIIKDMSHFMLLLTMTLMAFTTAFYVLFEKVKVRAESDEDAFNWWFFNWSNGADAGRGSFFICFHMMLGEFADQLPFFKLLDQPATKYHWYTARTLFLLFMMAICIVLLNLLIAIMGESYGKVMGDGVVDDWRYEQAGVVLNIEAGLSDKQLHNPLYFPKWIHVLEPAHVKPYEEGEDYKFLQLEELLNNVSELLEYKRQKKDDMLDQLDENINKINAETAKVGQIQSGIVAAHKAVKEAEGVYKGRKTYLQEKGIDLKKRGRLEPIGTTSV